MSMELEDKTKTIELLQDKLKREKVRYESTIVVLINILEFKKRS